MRSFIIHLPGDDKRAPNVQRLLSDLPDAEVFDAVNGRDPTQVAHVTTHQGTLLQPRYPFELTPAEIGVFQSHRACWRRIVEDGLDYALIAEDDLRVDRNRLNQALAMIAAHGTPDMYVRLPVKQRERPLRVVAEKNGMKMILPRTVGLQCICQVVGRNAANNLLAATEEIDRPVDTLLQMHWATKQSVHTILPNGNQEVAAELGGSTIQTKIKGRGKIMREVKRAWYRAQVALRPQKS